MRTASVAVFALCIAVPALSAEKSDPLPVVRLIRVPHDGIQPQAAVDEDGVIHLVYFSGDPAQGDLFYVRSADAGATFSQPLRVNSQPGSAIAAGTIRGGQVAIGRNGRVHVAWNGSRIATPEGPLNPQTGKPGAPMLYTRLDHTGNAFEPQRNLMRRSFGLDGGGAVAADRDGNVFVAWHGTAAGGAATGEAGRQVWLARSTDEGRSFAAEAPAWSEPTGACGCCGLGIYSGKAGTLYLLYRSAREATHRDIYALASEDKGKTFQGRLLHEWEINACPMSSMGFAESPETVLGAWETAGQVYFGTLNRGSRPARGSATGAGKGRKHPRLATNGRETILIWTEGTGWQRGGSLAWQVFDRSDKPLPEAGRMAGVPVWSFGAVVAHGPNAFLIFY